MKKLFTVLVMLFSLSLIAVAQSADIKSAAGVARAAPDTKPDSGAATLAEATNLIKEKLKGKTYLSTLGETTFKNTVIVAASVECLFSYRLFVESQSSKSNLESTVTFSLIDIDTARITVEQSGDYFMVKVPILNDQNKINSMVMRMDNKPSNITINRPFTVFGFSDKETAEQVAAAFRHAGSLCAARLKKN